MRQISEAIRVKKISDVEVILYQGDITLVVATAIVNAANTSLLGGGGVDGAIHRHAGKKLRTECQELYHKGGCKPGIAKITTGGDLPAQYVIHTVGPVWMDGTKNESQILANCYRNSLLLAKENKIPSIIFPSISTGIFNYPIKKAAEVAKLAVLETIANTSNIKQIGWCLYDEETFKIYKKVWLS